MMQGDPLRTYGNSQGRDQVNVILASSFCS